MSFVAESRGRSCFRSGKGRLAPPRAASTQACCPVWVQTEKNSVRAYVFCFALKLGHCAPRSACLKSANTDLAFVRSVQNFQIQVPAAYYAHPACMGLCLSRRHHVISVVLCHSILLFDLRRKHSLVPTHICNRRRAQRRSRTALLQRRRRLVLDGREHGGRLLAIGWLARAMIRGEPAIGRDQSREPRLYSVEPVWVQTMKQSYASAGKAPRRRVHSSSGIAAIAVFGLPPPRIVISYLVHQA